NQEGPQDSDKFEAMTIWEQYSISGNFPLDAVALLPDYDSRWHFLFEPQLLVRIEGGIKELPAAAKWGDTAESSPSGANGRVFYGEEEFYGSSALWEANANFLHANSELVKTMLITGQNNFKMQRKAIHLLCNQFGMDRKKELIFLLRSAVRTLYLWI